MGNYLYNGVEAGALPAVDKIKLPHAVMWLNDRAMDMGMLGDTDVLIVYFLSEITVTKGADKDFLWCADGDQSVRTERAYNSTEAFPAFGDIETHTAAASMYLENIVWTNTDLYRSDGTLYLAASDPVPVVTTPDPKSMLTAWLVGRRIAKQRAKGVTA